MKRRTARRPKSGVSRFMESENRHVSSVLARLRIRMLSPRATQPAHSGSFVVGSIAARGSVATLKLRQAWIAFVNTLLLAAGQAHDSPPTSRRQVHDLHLGAARPRARRKVDILGDDHVRCRLGAWAFRLVRPESLVSFSGLLLVGTRCGDGKGDGEGGGGCDGGDGGGSLQVGYGFGCFCFVWLCFALLECWRRGQQPAR